MKPNTHIVDYRATTKTGFVLDGAIRIDALNETEAQLKFQAYAEAERYQYYSLMNIRRLKS